MSYSFLPLLQVQLTRYGIPLIIVLGVIGNVFIVILFNHRRQNACSTYLSWAAVMNSVAIIINLIYIVYSVIHGDPTNQSLVLCQLRYYMPQIFSQTGRYLIVLACMDRYFLSTNYVRFRIINRPLVTRCLIGIVFIFWCIFLTYTFILTTINNGQCGQFGVNYILFFLHLMIFVCALPLVFMSIFGFLAYQNMRRLHTRVQPVGNNSNGNVGNIIVNRRDRELLVMTLAEIVVYTLTIVPYPIFMLEINLTDFMGIFKSVERHQIENFLSTLALVFIYLNCSAAFYTYITVSRIFRQDFKKLFVNCKCRMIRRINPTHA